MNTVKLFQQDAYMKACTSKILEISYSNDSAFLVLDATIFFPTGGGQSCDLGSIGGFSVIDVIERDGVIFHCILNTGNNIVLNPGDEVNCTLDWNRRFVNMQRHCGEHILSGIFFREFGGVNRGFHMGEEYMTIDISLESSLEFTVLTQEMALVAERFANEVIWSNAPVTTRRYASKEEAESLPLRKALAIENDISIVCVGDISNPSDCVACCGTHPQAAGEVGLIKILKIESSKGMFRVYFKAGSEALEDYEKKHEILTALNQKYSAATYDLIEKINSQDDKVKAVKHELNTLKQSVIKSRIEEISAELNRLLSISDNSVAITVREYGDLKVDDLLNIGRPLALQVKKLLLIISSAENTLLLFSNGNVDCGKLVKENASIYNGKGGGNNLGARAIFPNREYLDTFIDLIEKHLR